ncbi:MAG: class I adenylate-forming enzyme family protein [Granulosicoccus sp.]
MITICDSALPGEKHDYESLLKKGDDTACPTVVHTDEPWCLMYTSGTTGQPKGAIRSHRGMTMLALMTAIELKLQREDNALLVMPMCYANSLNFFTAFIHCGATVTIFSRPSFDPELCLRTFAETGASFTSLVPTHYNLLLEVQRKQHASSDYTRVEKLMISSAPARPDTKRAIMEMFPNSGLFELYGSTEAGWVTMLHPHEQFDKLGTVGREVIGSRPIKLLDDKGDEVPDGTPGELYSCGPYCFDGYWQQPEATAAAFRDCYLSVGDIAQRNADGFIRLIDRKKNVIISGGENIYPSEVEALLGAHPSISDVAVIGKNDSLWGERVVAAVVLQADASISSHELLRWGKEHMAGYKRPREIVFLKPQEMPRNTTGKILHRELRSRLAINSNGSDSLSVKSTDVADDSQQHEGN